MVDQYSSLWPRYNKGYKSSRCMRSPSHIHPRIIHNNCLHQRRDKHKNGKPQQLIHISARDSRVIYKIDRQPLEQIKGYCRKQYLPETEHKKRFSAVNNAQARTQHKMNDTWIPNSK